MSTFSNLHGSQVTGNDRAPFVPQPVQRPADQIRLSILEAMISGRLRPGDRLPSEAEQARGFKVSRGVVREALRSLAHVGLITVAQGRQGGWFVNQFDSAPVEQNLREAMELLLHFQAINLAELVEARRAVEGTCARLGAERATPEEVAGMRETIQLAHDPGLDDEAWLQLDIRFHRAVARSAHNRALIVPMAALHGVVQPRLNRAILHLLSRERINAQHAEIYQAIAAHDPARAERAVGRHLDELEALYRRAGLLRPSS
ncbi:MAG TPA: FadR/GntR family transcriptional regulator [Candidatus Dormibacteraeota bacterium]|jgi:GntR family transcriptional repressor for pyruvate dehydrogenase complex|nr:FadR/GntR family transcriptional regulator [Candidatus Dormibacteraeota bacterium]